MASENGAGIGPDSLPRRELDELRRSLLPVYTVAQLVVVWAWVFYVAYRNVELWTLDGAVLVVVLCSVAAFRARKSHYALACWLSVLGLVCAQSLIVAAWPDGLTLAFGLLAVVVAYALLGAWQAATAGAIVWVSQAAAWRLATGMPMALDLASGAAMLCLLTWGAVCIGGRPLRRSVDIALSGWSQLQASLQETRARRAELYRAVRALDEATYRIQRMNNQLTVAREAAESARASKARFAAVVSHELRGPLNLILGFSRLMALSPESYGVDLPSAYRPDVDAVYENSRQLVALLDDILDLSRVEVDRMPLVKDRVDVEAEVIEEVANLARPLASRRNLYLRLELAGNLPPVLADRVRLRQVLLNLLTNAIRFTERGGVSIRTSQAESGLLVTVEDTGLGISADEMPKLFDEFQQLHGLEDAGLKGTGLGLAISKHIIELHGGRIWAESTKGVGTAFHFTLPGLEQASWSPTLAGGTARVLRTRPTCLIVHRSPLATRLLARHIGSYQVVGLSDLERLVPLVRDLQPRAIITADDLSEDIRGRLARAALGVPVLSCEMQSFGEPRIEGALLYLMKPVAPEMIEAVMRQVERDGETTVLLVDDDRDAVRLLERILGSLPRPYRILRAYGGVQALETMRTSLPDIVFMDLLMPGMAGEEVIAQMRADQALHEVPVVVVSAREADAAPATLGLTWKLHLEQPLDLAKGAHVMRTLLDALDPSLPLQADDA